MSNMLLSSLSSSNRIKKELLFGEEYRINKSRAFSQPLTPVRSPFDIAQSDKTIRVKKRIEDISHPSTVSHNEIRSGKKCKSKSVPQIKNSFWERAKLTHKQYIDVLAMPHLQSCGDNKNQKNSKSKTTSHICSPRIIQMSCPNKRRVLANWQSFESRLPPEIIQRFHDMLHTNQNIDLKEARRYFKLRDRKKRRQLSRKKLKKMKKKNIQKAEWLRGQVEDISTVIMNFFSDEPRLEINYKQLLISDTLLVPLAKVLRRKNPILRYSRNLLDKHLVKMVDKISVWIDSVFKIVEMQSLEEDEDEMKAGDVASAVSSITGASELTDGEISEEIEDEMEMEAEEEELDEEQEEEKEQEDEDEEVHEEDNGEEMENEEKLSTGDRKEVEKISSLEKLIRILAHGSPSYLGGHLEELDNLTRNELLNKIKVLNKDYSGEVTPAKLLKNILKDWAMHNWPSQVDLPVLKKIDKVAELLAAMMAAEDVYGMLGTLPVASEHDIPQTGFSPSDMIATTDYGEEGEPLPGTMTEVIAKDGSIQLGVVDEGGEIQPVHMTPSGNLIPTVYDKKGKVVDKLFDDQEHDLDFTFNKFGVPVPDTYDGALFDDENYEHELIYDERGKTIPQCYDKDGNPIYAAYDEDGNPIFFGPDGKPISLPPGCSAKIINGKLTIIGPDGNIIEDIEEEKEVEREMEIQGASGEDGFEEEFLEEKQAEHESIEEEEEKKEEEKSSEDEKSTEEEKSSEEERIGIEVEERGEASETPSRESMITVIKGHKSKKIYEHSKDTICCLSLKIWAVWLLEITHNAHNWTKWVSSNIGQIREFAAILRGEVLLPNGQKKVLFKNDWNTFVSIMNEDVIAWRQYCRHVNDLTNKIVDKFHGKKVRCCQKCLQDHLIKNVVTAHDTMTALTEALNCAGYWQRCLDEIVQVTEKLTNVSQDLNDSSSDIETGWSYSDSSDEIDSCYKKRSKVSPSSLWKKLRDTPCSCPCKLKQLFPKKVNNTNNEGTSCGCVDLKMKVMQL